MNIGAVTVTMNNWIVESDHSILLGTSGENAVARLDIITTVDAGWIYMLEIEHLERGEKNIIPLTAETNKVYAVLTSEMLGNRGGKKLQIRAINGEQVKKSNVFRGYVNNSVNASENIPEHTQTVIDEAVERVDELATNAQSSAAAAETSATNAGNSAAAAERAAQDAANSAAANYGDLKKDAVIDRNAFNYAYTLLQAELRDVQKRLLAAEAKLTALTS